MMMASQHGILQARHKLPAQGFSMLEMLVSISIIVLLMSAVFPFLFQSQKRFQSHLVVSEANQSARAALEVMSQEIGQAGYNPEFTTAKTSSTVPLNNGCPEFIVLSDIQGISPGDWVSVDTGANNELLEVFSTSAAVTPPTCSPCGSCPTAPTGPWILAKFEQKHLTTPYSVASYKMPYGGGLLYTTGSPPPDSNDWRLEFFGDINQDQTINFVVYSISAMSPTQTVCIPAVAPGTTCPSAQTYTLYKLYRSITPVPFLSLPPSATYTAPNNNTAAPMVEKVLYNTTTLKGPTGQPIFSYPNTITVGVVPNQITVVGTIVITLCVAVNPQALETGQVQWYTMATQIRPLNLAAAVNVNNSNGGLYLPPSPRSVPMAFPTSYYP